MKPRLIVWMLGLALLLALLSFGSCVAGYGPVRLKWPEPVDASTLHVVSSRFGFDPYGNFEIYGEIENRGPVTVGPVLLGVTLLDSAGNVLVVSPDADRTLRTVKEGGRRRLGWDKNVVQGHGMRKRVPPGEKTPFWLPIEGTRIPGTVASLRFVTSGIQAKPAPSAVVQGFTRVPDRSSYRVLGDLVNQGPGTCEFPRAIVALHDSAGALVSAYVITPYSDSLPAGDKTALDRRESSLVEGVRPTAWGECS